MTALALSSPASHLDFLPPPWCRVWCQGYVYYYNHLTNESAWELPPEYVPTAPASAVPTARWGSPGQGQGQQGQGQGQGSVAVCLLGPPRNMDGLNARDLAALRSALVPLLRSLSP